MGNGPLKTWRRRRGRGDIRNEEISVFFVGFEFRDAVKT